MSRAALPGAHAGADASSARGDPSEEETGETVPDGDVDASTSVSRERERDAPSDVGLVAMGGLRATRAQFRSPTRAFARGGRAGSVAVEGAVEDARSRFRAGVVVAVRLRCADDVGVFLLGERGVGARGWEFRAGVVAGFGGTETTRTRARRGRRSGWCVPRVHARIVDSRFGCRVRSRRRGGWGARRPSWRAGARLGWVVPPGVPNRARVDARGKGVERRGTRDRDTHARTIVIGRSVSRARAATGTEGADGTRDGCARLGTCASRRLFVW